MTQHLGCPIPSPAIMEKIGTAFRRAVSTFAEAEHIPVVRFGKADRKIDVMRRHVAAQAATGRSGVAAIGVAQEYRRVLVHFPAERLQPVCFASRGTRPAAPFISVVWTSAGYGSDRPSPGMISRRRCVRR
jgi:hypothetical protein